MDSHPHLESFTCLLVIHTTITLVQGLYHLVTGLCIPLSVCPSLGHHEECCWVDFLTDQLLSYYIPVQNLRLTPSPHEGKRGWKWGSKGKMPLWSSRCFTVGPQQCSNINFLIPILAFSTIYYFLNVVLPFFPLPLPLSLQPLRISFLLSLKTKCILSVIFLSKNGLFCLSSLVYQLFYHWQYKMCPTLSNLRGL